MIKYFRKRKFKNMFQEYDILFGRTLHMRVSILINPNFHILSKDEFVEYFLNKKCNCTYWSIVRRFYPEEILSEIGEYLDDPNMMGFVVYTINQILYSLMRSVRSDIAERRTKNMTDRILSHQQIIIDENKVARILGGRMDKMMSDRFQ